MATAAYEAADNAQDSAEQAARDAANADAHAGRAESAANSAANAASRAQSTADEKANKGTYQLHGPVDIVSEVYRTTIDFGTPVGQQNLVTDAAREDPSRYYIELN